MINDKKNSFFYKEIFMSLILLPKDVFLYLIKPLSVKHIYTKNLLQICSECNKTIDIINSKNKLKYETHVKNCTYTLMSLILTCKKFKTIIYKYILPDFFTYHTTIRLIRNNNINMYGMFVKHNDIDFLITALKYNSISIIKYYIKNNCYTKYKFNNCIKTYVNMIDISDELFYLLTDYTSVIKFILLNYMISYGNNMIAHKVIFERFDHIVQRQYDDNVYYILMSNDSIFTKQFFVKYYYEYTSLNTINKLNEIFSKSHYYDKFKLFCNMYKTIFF